MTDSTPSTRHDQMTDLAWVLLTAAGDLALLLIDAGTQGKGWISGPAPLAYGADAGIGALASALLWYRRRWPAGVAVALVVPAVLARSAQVAAVASLFNVSTRSRPAVVVGVAVAHQVAFLGFSRLWITYPWWASSALELSYNVTAVALGLYVRARRGLVESLNEQVRQAEATRDLMAEQARRAERARIAVEMHDVLAHRVSLMALHAGGLEVRPDLPPEQVRETAVLIRSTGRQALTELRDIIGVLRDAEGTIMTSTGAVGAGAEDPGAEDTEAPRAPQPTLADIAGLVDGYRQAGLNVALDLSIDDPEAAPGPLGRDAYRTVREALTNVSKHAAGTAATVALSGRPGEGLRVTVRNKLPLTRPRTAQSAELALPGAGLGLVALAERVALAGGTLVHGPDGKGDFVLEATFRWEKDWR